MIRMSLLVIGFLAVTLALIVFQPGARHARFDEPQHTEVTRADPTLNRFAPGQEPMSAIAPAPARSSSAPVATAAPVPSQPAAIRPAAPVTPIPLPDSDLRRMTWSTLANLNAATGRETAPGQPGSLLHTIVQRSLQDGAPGAPTLDAKAADLVPLSYRVKPGDSLASIAEALYGDVNMTGPLFAANRTILTRPDDLRAGQVLSLPN